VATPFLTETGFERPVQDDIAADIAADQRGTISAQLDVSESTVIGNLNNVFADHLAQAYEALEEAYNGHDPDNATGDRLVALALLTGTERRGEQQGTVTETCTLAASKTFDVGDLAVHAVDDPTNRWTNRDVVTTTTSGAYSVTFLSDAFGSDTTAAAGTLTVIASPIDGFTAATNAEDATPGRDVEDIETLRSRREDELALGGSGTVEAIRADVLQLDGVIECLVEENTTDATVGALPPHSYRVVVWDGDPGLVPDDDIAQVILATGPAGIPAIGDIDGNAVRADGTVVTRSFARAEVVDVYISANITSAVGVSADDVKASLAAAMPSAVGGDVVYNRMSAAVFIEGVDDFASFTIGTAPSPVGVVSISISNTQIAQLDLSHIVLTGDVS
jgi:uncharacterized phage protein gp47/JayE